MDPRPSHDQRLRRDTRMTIACTITPTPPTSIQLRPGQEGRFSFTVTSTAAPDTVRRVIFQALLVGLDGKHGEVDWMIAGPQRSLNLAGGKTETITITVRPTAASPRGENTIRLAIADRDQPNDEYAYSAPVVCEVLAADVTPP